MIRHFDKPSLSVIVITLVLFIAALFAKGFTHDLFLEAGVFLVSAKLILMSYKSKVQNDKLLSELEAIKELMGRQNTPGKS